MESRTQKTLKNAKVNIIYIFISVGIAFFSRKIFLDFYGTEFVGLTTTLQSLLGFLNLAELGIGMAIGVTLYRPLAQQDKKSICEIITVLSVIYRFIGFFILFVGIILSLFLSQIFSKTDCPIFLVYFAYFTFLSSSLFTYFINYKQTLLTADQKNYVVVKYTQVFNVIKLLLQMGLACIYANMYLWVVIEFVFGINYCIVLNRQIHKSYPWLNKVSGDVLILIKKYPTVITYTRQLFISKIASFSQSQISPILIYSFVSLTTVALYSNYLTVTSKLSLFVNALLGSTEASVGNLIAEGNKEKIYGVYQEMLAIRCFIAGLFVSMLYFFLVPFITLWLGSQFVLSHYVLILILLDVFISQMRGATSQFIEGYGLFKDVWSSYAEVVIYLIVAIIGGHYWSLEGVLLGTIVSKFLITGIWKPYFLFSQGFKLPVIRYWHLLTKNFLIILSTIIVVLFIKKNFIGFSLENGWCNLIISGLIVLFLYLLINIPLLYMLVPGTRSLFMRLHKR